MLQERSFIDTETKEFPSKDVFLSWKASEERHHMHAWYNQRVKPSTHVKTEQQNKVYIQTTSHKTDRHNMSYDNKTDPLSITALPAYKKWHHTGVPLG